MSSNLTAWISPTTTLTNSENLQLVPLDIFLCGFIDVPETGIDCSTREPGYCIKCDIRGGYLTGESINEYNGYGHIFCRIVWYFCLIVSIIGTVMNGLIVLVIRRRRSNRSFDFLLSLLAQVDLLCCFTSLGSSTASVAYFGN